MRKLTVFLALSFILLSVLFFYSWYRVHESLYAGNIPLNETPKTYRLTFETRIFKSTDGKNLEGWYIPAKNAKAVIIMAHGYRDTKGTIVEHSKYLHTAGYSTFFIDYASDAPDTKITLGVKEYKDLEEAYDYMRSLKENKNKKIGFFGGSLGASTSIITAGKTGKGDFVIASVLFANYKSLFEQRIKLENLPPFLLSFVRIANAAELGFDYESYSPDKYIKNITKPILLISSKNDVKVNSKDAKYLYNLANKSKYYWEADAQHDIYNDKPKEYEKHILSFLEKAIK